MYAEYGLALGEAEYQLAAFCCAADPESGKDLLQRHRVGRCSAGVDANNLEPWRLNRIRQIGIAPPFYVLGLERGKEKAHAAQTAPVFFLVILANNLQM